MRFLALVTAGFLAVSAPAMAEVITANSAGFEVTSTEIISASPGDVYLALRAPAKWWNPTHTYSNDAQNLWMDAQAGGCFCEKLPSTDAGQRGSVEHGRIVFAQPGKILRMQGGLGPLQSEAAIATLTWTLEAVKGGTKITQRYVVGGYISSGAEALAPMVDSVLGEQLGRLKALFDQPSK